MSLDDDSPHGKGSNEIINEEDDSDSNFDTPKKDRKKNKKNKKSRNHQNN